jgi:transcriptional regulator with XRE-family HTH domain
MRKFVYYRTDQSSWKGRIQFLENREYESPIHELRGEKGFTVRELAQMCSCSAQLILNLALGISSPLDRGGIIKPIAHKLAEVLETDLETLFPRYFCVIQQNDIVPEQLQDISISEYSSKYANPNDTCVEFTDALFEIIAKLPSMQRKVMILRFWEGLTLDECGKVFNLSRERIRQMEAKALRALRKYIQQNRKDLLISSYYHTTEYTLENDYFDWCGEKVYYTRHKYETL